MQDFRIQLQILRMQTHSTARFSVSLERDMTEKSHKTSFKEHRKIACLSSTIPPSLYSLPPLTPPLALLPPHRSDGESGGLGYEGENECICKPVP